MAFTRQNRQTDQRSQASCHLAASPSSGSRTAYPSLSRCLASCRGYAKSSYGSSEAVAATMTRLGGDSEMSTFSSKSLQSHCNPVVISLASHCNLITNFGSIAATVYRMCANARCRVPFLDNNLLRPHPLGRPGDLLHARSDPSRTRGRHASSRPRSRPASRASEWRRSSHAQLWIRVVLRHSAQRICRLWEATGEARSPSASSRRLGFWERPTLSIPAVLPTTICG
jgi:hypothetical protein